MPRPIKHALVETYEDVLRNHTLQMAAALSYYFVLSLFPCLIFLSAIVAYLPVPNLFDQALSMMTRFLPSDSMGLVSRVLSDVITPNRRTFLSFGILGTLWTASGGFAAAIEALNIAYDVEDDRPFHEPLRGRGSFANPLRGDFACGSADGILRTEWIL